MTASFGSAKWCWSKANKLTKAKLEKYPLNGPAPCLVCEGTGVTNITTKYFDSGKVQTMEMKCITCNGSKIVDAEKQKFIMVKRFVWCSGKCNGASMHYAYDGRAVFGNDTYLCDKCGMVTQFG